MKKILLILVLSIVYFSSNNQVLAGYGTAPANHSAPVCNNEKPGQAQFSFVRKSGTHQIEVGWNAVDRATSWTIAYGKQSGKYIYGIPDFGNNESRAVYINILPPGTYYIVIKANNGCMPGNFSTERRITVSKNGTFYGYQRNRFGSYFTRPVVTPNPIEVDINVSNSISTPSSSPTPTSFINALPTPVAVPVAPVKKLGLFQRIWIFFFGN